MADSWSMETVQGLRIGTGQTSLLGTGVQKCCIQGKCERKVGTSCVALLRSACVLERVLGKAQN